MTSKACLQASLPFSHSRLPLGSLHSPISFFAHADFFSPFSVNTEPGPRLQCSKLFQQEVFHCSPQNAKRKQRVNGPLAASKILLRQNNVEIFINCILSKNDCGLNTLIRTL